MKSSPIVVWLGSILVSGTLVTGCLGAGPRNPGIPTLDWELLRSEAEVRGVVIDWELELSGMTDGASRTLRIVGDVVRDGPTLLVESRGSGGFVRLNWADGSTVDELGAGTGRLGWNLSGTLRRGDGDDVLLVYDDRSDRVVAWDTSGEILDSRVIPLSDEYMGVRLIGEGSEGELYFFGTLRPEQVVQGRQMDRSVLMAVDLEGEARIVRRLEGPEVYHRIDSDGTILRDLLLFGRLALAASAAGVLWEADHDGLWLIHPHSGERELRTRFVWEPHQVSDQEWELGVEIALARIGSDLLRERRRDLLERIPRLSQVPLLEHAEGFASGEVWVRRQPAPSWRTTEWVGFDRDGHPLRAVSLPMDWRLVWADHEGWVAVVWDIETESQRLIRGRWD